MGEFEDFIKAKYPVDYESLKEKYPNVPIVEFYGDEQDVWNHQQSKIDQLEKRIKEGLEKIEQCEKEGCLFPEWLYWAKKALRGECE